MRITKGQIKIMTALGDSTQAEPMYGREAMRRAEVGPGSFYPNVELLEQRGWVDSRFECPEPLSDRARRRCYWLTEEGGRGLRRTRLKKTPRWRLGFRPATAHA